MEHLPSPLYNTGGVGLTMTDALGRLGKKFEEVPLIGGKSNFVKPCSLLFELDGEAFHISHRGSFYTDKALTSRTYSRQAAAVGCGGAT